MAPESPYSTRSKLLQVLNDLHFARINIYYDCPCEGGGKDKWLGHILETQKTSVWCSSIDFILGVQKILVSLYFIFRFSETNIIIY